MTPNRDSLRQSDADTLREITRLHDEAFEKRMTIDGHRKISEGQVTLYLTSTDDRRDRGMDALAVTGVEIYAYVVGPSRSHSFASLDGALEVVQAWHKEAMEWTPEGDDV